MPYEITPEVPVKRSLLQKVEEWLVPRTIGKFGISINFGGREVFFGVSISRVIMETVVTRRALKKQKYLGSTHRVVDF